MFWVVIYTLAGISLLSEAISFLFGDAPSLFSSVVTYAAFGLIVIVMAFETYMDIPKKGLNNQQVKKVLDAYKPENPKTPYSTMEGYIHWLVVGVNDGWLKFNRKELEAIRWMIRNISECEKYVKRTESEGE
ncbi:hypothetical protein [Oceanobacillus oncorhynchi]|uniref:hypothetical protein n=1 Tax=Oceanobacillus oncorhynchi TaxID=545501 RepID=UPI0034D67D95